MQKILLFTLLAWPSSYVALADETGADNSIRTSSSPENRVVFLELYTSEGCSSCPPADRLLSGLRSSGISNERLIPVAFHVTYWDYIGWKDRFAKKQYDQRQRVLAARNSLNTIYTPQFVMSGEDYRSHATFLEDVNKLAAEKATVSISLSARILSNAKGSDEMHLGLTADTTMSDAEDIAFFLLLIEDKLTSDVNDGENKGIRLHHDHVVRQLLGPYYHNDPKDTFRLQQAVTLEPQWKRRDISIVSFAENQRTGEVLQAAILKYYQE